MGSHEQLQRQILAEGKTKIIWASGDSTHVFIESKDDITAGDGAKHDIIPNKGALSTRITTNCFNLLDLAGIPNHFIQQENETTFLAQKIQMVPLEVVSRRFAYGSYLRRNPNALPGESLGGIEVEFYAKDDARHDPYVVYDFANGKVRLHDPKQKVGPDSLLSEEDLSSSRFRISEDTAIELGGLAIATFEVLEDAWDRQGVRLADMKIECGYSFGSEELVVADVIDNDSWRLWPGGDPNQMVDKQLYRDGHSIDEVAANYLWVAEATDRFFSS
jgi:phosphoribosylaminoimidazole-succinocarboxamide synthase